MESPGGGVDAARGAGRGAGCRELHAVLMAETGSLRASGHCLTWRSLQLPGVQPIKGSLLVTGVLIVEKLSLRKISMVG